MRLVLPVIVISQFFSTSLWFAGNSIISDLIKSFHLDQSFLVPLTTVVQFGFISGTFIFALFTISDRFSPSLVFFISSILAALFNLGLCAEGIHSNEILLFRFFTGFFLAGIYPVGMKIASDYYQEGLGKSLGFLVGALVIGTALPHLLKSLTSSLPWKFVVFSTSSLSVIGGFAIFFFVPNGPYRKQSQKLNLRALLKSFKYPNFRSASFGYFGHMWELYTFWAFVPVILAGYKIHYPMVDLNIPLLSFLIIASGGVACFFSGLISNRFGAKKIAVISLLLSCLCCLCSPFLLFNSSVFSLIAFLFFWGIVVVADSPLFSTLVARNAPEESRGTSLTIVNCIGFSITIFSIQFISAWAENIGSQYIYTLLAIGPILGLIALFTNKEG